MASQPIVHVCETIRNEENGRISCILDSGHIRATGSGQVRHIVGSIMQVSLPNGDSDVFLRRIAGVREGRSRRFGPLKWSVFPFSRSHARSQGRLGSCHPKHKYTCSNVPDGGVAWIQSARAGGSAWDNSPFQVLNFLLHHHQQQQPG